MYNKLKLSLIAVLVFIGLNVVIGLLFVNTFIGFGTDEKYLDIKDSSLLDEESFLISETTSKETMKSLNEKIVDLQVDSCFYNRIKIEKFHRKYNSHQLKLKCLKELYDFDKDIVSVIDNSKTIFLNKVNNDSIKIRLVLSSNQKEGFRIEHSITNYKTEDSGHHRRTIKLSDFCFYVIRVY